MKTLFLNLEYIDLYYNSSDDVLFLLIHIYLDINCKLHPNLHLCAKCI
jgi:hypothetical protein